MITLRFSDGTIITASTWSEVEDQLRASQWEDYATRREFRREMRHRAWVWSGRKPKLMPQTPKQFIQGLAEAGLFSIEEEE